MKTHLNAKNLRILLSVVMLLMAAGAVTGFIFAQKQLQEFATSISQIEADAKAGDDNVETLNNLETTLEGVRDVKVKADSVAVPAAKYPVAVMNNISNLAAKSGVSLTAISYNDAEVSAGTTPQPATPDATTTPATTTPAAPSGVSKKMINVTPQSPVSYSSFMSFLRRIENDDMYLHVTKVSITKGEGNTITTQPLIIEVYVR